MFRGETMTLPAIRFAAFDRARVLPVCEELAPLTLVQAPSGYGKTTAVRQFADRLRRQGGAVCWVRCATPEAPAERSSLEAPAPDPGSPDQGFWRRLREGLERSLPEHGSADPRPAEARPAEARSDDREIVERLVGALADRTVLVLDDYERVTAPQLDLDLAELLSHSPLLSVVVVAARCSVLDGPLVTSRVTVSHIDADALAFTREEVAELASLRGLDPETVPETLWLMTQGWPVAVSLALGELAAGSSACELEASLGRFADQHLELVGHPAARRVFYSVVLCKDLSVEMLMGIAGATAEQNKAALRAIEDRGLVRRGWFKTGARYRCHPGIARFFERPALAGIGGEAATKLRRVHAMNLSLDDPDASITQLLELGDFALAERLLAANFLTVIEPSTRFLEVVRRIPLDELKEYPLIGSVLLLCSMSDPHTAPVALDRMHVQLRESALGALMSDASPVVMVTSLAVLIVVERLRGAGVESLRLARDLEQRITRVSDGSLAPLKQSMSLITAIIALTGVVNGDIALAERSFQRTLQFASACGDDSEQVRAWCGLTLVAAMTGDFGRARERLRETEELMRRTGLRGPQMSWLNLEAARALLAVEDLDAEAFGLAFEHVEQLLDRAEIAPIFVFAEALIIRGLRGEHEALTVLRRRVPQMNAAFQATPYQLVELAALRANFVAYVGGYEGAEAMLGRLPDRFPAVALGRARLHLFRGEPAAARECALGLLSDELPTRLATDAALIVAVAEWELGETELAIARLAPAVAALRGFGMARLLAGVPFESLHALVTAAFESRNGDDGDDGEGGDGGDERMRGYASLLRALEALPETLRVKRFEPLSRAELRTLRALAAGRTSAQVAEALFVSQNTVKFHLRGIYRKLGVSTRAEALSRAADQGLLDEPGGCEETA